ncbi:hypothetical protein LTS10_005595 [Elasticomyces elasticus]|nr:hypothetical protein LTS10_005595 [Elasticomyces elasticus]
MVFDESLLYADDAVGQQVNDTLARPHVDSCGMSVAQSSYAQNTSKIRCGDEEQRECLPLDDELKVDMTMETQATGEWLRDVPPKSSREC